jgi:hypothetical protein
MGLSGGWRFGTSGVKLDYLAANNTEAVFGRVQPMKDLNPWKESTHFYNQLVGDSFARMPLEKVDASWAMLDRLSDYVTRSIAAQRLFGVLYENDSILATSWLNKVPDGQDKKAAVSYLVQRLEAEGLHEEAKPWKALLPVPK